MIAMQVVLLKIALDHRPPPSSKGGDAAAPFSAAHETNIFSRKRPYSFWQWRSPKP
jgi:solute carrier family 66, member 2